MTLSASASALGTRELKYAREVDFETSESLSVCSTHTRSVDGKTRTRDHIRKYESLHLAPGDFSDSEFKNRVPDHGSAALCATDRPRVAVLTERDLELEAVQPFLLFFQASFPPDSMIDIDIGPL